MMHGTTNIKLIGLC